MTDWESGIFLNLEGQRQALGYKKRCFPALSPAQHATYSLFLLIEAQVDAARPILRTIPVLRSSQS